MEPTNVQTNRSAFLRTRDFIMRNRIQIQDLSLIILTLLVGAYFAFEIDVFRNEDRVTRHEETIELDEVLVLSVLLAGGMLIFTARRYREQKLETKRRIAAEQHARELAFRDPLTGLANRRHFDDALRTAIASPPAAGATHALYMLDLNGFKRVNDVHGHGVGDELLILIAERLLGAIREGDLVARLGGDEFAVLSRHLTGAEAATNVALRIIAALEDPVAIGNHRHAVRAGVGISLIPRDAADFQEAFRKADVALYRAKAEGRSALRFFEEEMDRHVRERAHIERQLRSAVLEDRIHLAYQPVVNLVTRRVTGFEAIPHWEDSTLGEVARERFLSIAEENGLIHELSGRLLTRACHTAADWPDDASLTFAISPAQMKDRALQSRIVSILRDSGLSPARLEIEITERALVEDLEAARSTLGALREIGVKIALSNFGTGYSSLYHLRNFRLDKIKIDRSFVESIGFQQDRVPIVNALIGLGQGLGVTVAADGIASLEQGASLRDTGCEQGQGFVFGTAVPAERTSELLMKNKKFAPEPAVA